MHICFLIVNLAVVHHLTSSRGGAHDDGDGNLSSTVAPSESSLVCERAYRQVSIELRLLALGARHKSAHKLIPRSSRLGKCWPFFLLKPHVLALPDDEDFE